MRKKVLYLIVSIILTFLFIGGVFIYFRFFPYAIENIWGPTKTIVVIDNSKVYDFSYRKSLKFENDIEDWGVWKEKFFSLNGKEYYTVRNIHITLSDTDNGVFKLTGKGPKIVSSANASMEKNGLLDIQLYLSPTLSKNTDRDTNAKTLFFPLAQQLFNPLHRGLMSDDEKLKAVVSLMTGFKTSKDLPYELSVQEK